MGATGQAMHSSFGDESFERVRDAALGLQEFFVVLKCAVWLDHGQSRNG